MVDGELPGGRMLDMDVYTNHRTTTTSTVNDAFSNAMDRTAVTGALSAGGFQLIYPNDDATGTLSGGLTDRIPHRYAFQLEIDAEANAGATSVDESKRVRVSDIADGASDSTIFYDPDALGTTDAGTPAWFYGIPGRVVCGGTPVDCGDTLLAQPNQPRTGGLPPGQWFYQGSGGLTFHADDPGAESHEFYVEDTDWVVIGAWAVRPEVNPAVADVRMGAFFLGPISYRYGSNQDIKAEYAGDAIGLYAERDGDAAAVSGKFKAAVNLTFDQPNNHIGGSITDFRLDGADEAENWRLTLTTTDANHLLQGRRGFLGGVADGTVLDGHVYMRSYGPQNPSTVDGRSPTALAGSFFVEPGSVTDHDLSLVGAFLAGRESAVDLR